MYTPYVIGNFISGLSKEVQPQLLPQEAFTELKNGYTRRSVLFSRNGYVQYAVGNGDVRVESRLVQTFTVVVATGDGVTKIFNWTGAGTTPPITDLPIRPYNVTLTATIAATPSSTTDVPVTTSAGTFLATADVVSGNIDYTTGDGDIEFVTAPDNLTDITLTYYFPIDETVLGFPIFVDSTNSKTFLALGETRANVFNVSTKTMVDITPTPAFTGQDYNYWTWTIYPDTAANLRLLFTNNVDAIQMYDGSTITPYAYTFTGGGVTLNTALHVIYYFGRLVILRPTINNVVRPQTVLYSDNIRSDNFDLATTTTTAATQDWIMSYSFQKEDLIVHFENSTRRLKFTGGSPPFEWEDIDTSRGSNAPYSGNSYLTMSTAVGRTGFVQTDGYQVLRYDDKIPRYTEEDINTDEMKRTYSGVNVELAQQWFPHTSIYDTTNDRVLAFSYEEQSWGIWDMPISVLGLYTQIDGLTIGAMTLPFSSYTEPFSSLISNKDSLFTLGGDYHGFIYNMNQTALDAVDENQQNGLAIPFSATTKELNPFLEEGKQCRLGYVDIQAQGVNSCTYYLEFYREESSTPVKAPVAITLDPTKGKQWFRIYCNQFGRFFKLRVYSSDPSATGARAVFYTFVFYFSRAGRLV
jgi:hypothetical protein